MPEVNYGNNFFYKFRPINEHTDSLLINNELYFNHPDNFNDPFDCKLDCFHKGTRDEWIIFFTQRGIHPTEASNIIKEYLKKGIMKQKMMGFCSIIQKRIILRYLKM